MARRGGRSCSRGPWKCDGWRGRGRGCSARFAESHVDSLLDVVEDNETVLLALFDLDWALSSDGGSGRRGGEGSVLWEETEGVRGKQRNVLLLSSRRGEERRGGLGTAAGGSGEERCGGLGGAASRGTRRRASRLQEHEDAFLDNPLEFCFQLQLGPFLNFFYFF